MEVLPANAVESSTSSTFTGPRWPDLLGSRLCWHGFVTFLHAPSREGQMFRAQLVSPSAALGHCRPDPFRRISRNLSARTLNHPLCPLEKVLPGYYRAVGIQGTHLPPRLQLTSIGDPGIDANGLIQEFEETLLGPSDLWIVLPLFRMNTEEFVAKKCAPYPA